MVSKPHRARTLRESQVRLVGWRVPTAPRLAHRTSRHARVIESELIHSHDSSGRRRTERGSAQGCLPPSTRLPCCIHENARKRPMTWTTPTLVEICIGLEINGYLPAEF